MAARRAVLGATAALFVLAALAGAGSVSRVTAGGLGADGSESSAASRFLTQHFETGDANLAFLVTATGAQASVDDAAVASAASEVTDALSTHRAIRQVESYWSLGKTPVLRSPDGKHALVLAVVLGSDAELSRTVRAVIPALERDDAGVRIEATGPAAVQHAVEARAERDLVRAERIALPLTVLLLVVAFRSGVAAGVPLVFGAVAIAGALAVLRVMVSLGPVSVFGLNVATALGFALAVDYSLLVVTRFREELAGHAAPEAVVRAIDTAGRAVLFSALTVVCSLAALLLFPIGMLRSIAVGGISVTALAALVALVPLPALLAVLGPRIDRFGVGPKRSGDGPTRVRDRLGAGVMRRPVLVAATVTVILVIAAVPFRGARFADFDERLLSEGNATRATVTLLREEFASAEASAIPVVLPGMPAGTNGAAVDEYARRLSGLDAVARVDAATGSYTTGQPIDMAALPTGTADALARLQGRFVAPAATWVSVVPAEDGSAAASDALVQAVRSVPSPGERFVGGRQAEFVDAKAALRERLPLALALVVGSTFVLLLVMFRSIVVPVKALLMDLLSLTAAFGICVFVFQHGHFAGTLGFTPTGTLYPAVLVLMFAIAFGLAMDYELFLLCRVKEEYDRTGDNDGAVRVALRQTGPLITSSALIMSVVFVSFATSEVATVKLLGVGMAAALLIDAFIVRTTLVPALMRLLGGANWWPGRRAGRHRARAAVAAPALEPGALGAESVRP